MGDLIAGIGDEVLLFGAFFILSILVVSLIARWRQQGKLIEADSFPAHKLLRLRIGFSIRVPLIALIVGWERD